MKFSTREDVEIPIEEMFKALCDFDAHERSAMRRGADVQRVDALAKPGVGMKWRARFKARGKMRDLEIEMVTFDDPIEMKMVSTTKGIDGVGVIELVALSRTQTRVRVEFDMKPTTLSARLLIQSLKLAKTSLTKRFKTRVAEYLKTFEGR